MITGHDTVLISRGGVDEVIRRFLDDLAHKWLNMRVSISGVQRSEFLSWPDLRDAVPQEGEILVARDETMENSWDELGYTLTEDGEGPFTIYYSTLYRSVTRILALEDPYVRDGFGFEPYEILLIGSGLALTTIVTPDVESEFSRRLIESLTVALQQA